jgi:hypothetical protein|tara:strand:+ start:475 stop:714 length:240 start_codon:yes stop_codon:yes gene_type:complete
MPGVITRFNFYLSDAYELTSAFYYFHLILFEKELYSSGQFLGDSPTSLNRGVIVVLNLNGIDSHFGTMALEILGERSTF